MARLLILEDEPVMAASLVAGLRRRGHTVDQAADGPTALEKAAHIDYDVILLDRDVPLLSGDAVCRQLTSRGNSARLLMLTAARSVDERVDGLRMGADDYLTKPFAFEELVARIEALVRRPEARMGEEIVVGDLRIDRPRRTVHRSGVSIELTAKEFGILLELAQAPGAVVSAEQLLDRVWDENADPFTNAVRVTMVGLRKKLGEPPPITTLRGVGYRLDVGPS